MRVPDDFLVAEESIQEALKPIEAALLDIASSAGGMT